MSSEPTVVLITGANQGIGYLTAKLLSQHDTYHIIIGSRSAQKGIDAVATLISEGSTKTTLSSVQLDVTNDDSISHAVKHIQATHGRLDILINNAGIAPTIPNIREQYRQDFETNVIGAVAMTDAFLPLLRKSASPRLVYVSSGLGSLTLASDSSNPFYGVDAMAYRVSKTALHMVVVQQHKILGKEGFKIWAVCPGYRATNLSGDKERAIKFGAQDPMGGAQIVVDVVIGKKDEHVGQLVWENGVHPW